MSLQITHNAGFFSCCSVFLHDLVNYFNTHHRLPTELDSSRTFDWYKRPDQKNEDITNEYFKKHNEGSSNFCFSWESYVNYHHIHQFENYKDLDYKNLNNFIVKYFSPSDSILNYITIFEEKYIKNNNFNYENLCVLFYRGNDKNTETELCGYDQFIQKGREVLAQNPNVSFLIQSDETEFIETMQREFPNSFYFKDEIRHMRKNNSTVDIVYRSQNYEFSKYYLAITMIMGKCKYIVCSSGNCSIWIMLFRMHANNVMQFLHNKWIQ